VALDAGIRLMDVWEWVIMLPVITLAAVFTAVFIA
jgi:hypothetical protein